MSTAAIMFQFVLWASLPVVQPQPIDSLKAVADAPRLLETLARDVAAGSLSPELAALYAYYGAFSPAHLPLKYTSIPMEPVRCATPILLDLQRALTLLPAETLNSIAPEHLPPGFAPRGGGGPCGLQQFPLSIASSVWPITVHYETEADLEIAADTLLFAEQAWDRQVVQMGFSAPLSDGGECANDGNLDVFLQHGLGYAYTLEVASDPATEHDDWSCFIVIDPDAWGDVFLETTVAHEFNHALQAADDWWEIGSTLESTATFIEEVTDDALDYYPTTIPGFNRRNELPFEYNDFYASYFMYGGVMYLIFLRDRYLEGDENFVADMWFNTRSPARGSYGHPELNEPDIHDAITAVLQPRVGVDYRDTLLEFSRWRWFVGSNDDGLHFEEAGFWPDNCQVEINAELDAASFPLTLEVTDGPRTYGVWYIRVMSSDINETACATFTGQADYDWHIETMRRGPGIADEWVFALDSDGSFGADLAGADEYLIKVVNLATPDYDPDYFQQSVLSQFTLDFSLNPQCPDGPACEGDANGDGTVDPLDAGYISARFACPVDEGDPECDFADVNLDGTVDPLDVGFVLARFGDCP